MIYVLLLGIALVFWWLIGSTVLITFAHTKTMDLLLRAPIWKRALAILFWPYTLLMAMEGDDEQAD